MKILKKIPLTIITTLLFLFFPFVVMTLITSKTPLLHGFRSFVVLSGSMAPLFPVGSMVYAIPQTDYRIGEIITFTDAKRTSVTHRITQITKSPNNQISYITKGDANNAADQSPITSDKITGKVFFFMPYMGLLINYIRTPIYFIALIIIPSLIFIGIELWAIKNEIVKHTEKKVLEKLLKQV